MPLFTGVALGDTGIKSQYFEGSGSAQYITGDASGGQGVRLRGLILTPGTGGAFGDDRWIDFSDNVTSGKRMFRIFVQKSGGNSGAAQSGFTYCLNIPGNGIRFPNGIKFTPTSNYVTSITVLYEG